MTKIITALLASSTLAMSAPAFAQYGVQPDAPHEGGMGGQDHRGMRSGEMQPGPMGGEEMRGRGVSERDARRDEGRDAAMSRSHHHRHHHHRSTMTRRDHG